MSGLKSYIEKFVKTIVEYHQSQITKDYVWEAASKIIGYSKLSDNNDLYNQLEKNEIQSLAYYKDRQPFLFYCLHVFKSINDKIAEGQKLSEADENFVKDTLKEFLKNMQGLFTIKKSQTIEIQFENQTYSLPGFYDNSYIGRPVLFGGDTTCISGKIVRQNFFDASRLPSKIESDSDQELIDKKINQLVADYQAPHLLREEQEKNKQLTEQIEKLIQENSEARKSIITLLQQNNKLEKKLEQQDHQVDDLHNQINLLNIQVNHLRAQLNKKQATPNSSPEQTHRDERVIQAASLPHPSLNGIFSRNRALGLAELGLGNNLFKNNPFSRLDTAKLAEFTPSPSPTGS